MAAAAGVEDTPMADEIDPPFVFFDPRPRPTGETNWDTLRPHAVCYDALKTRLVEKKHAVLYVWEDVTPDSIRSLVASRAPNIPHRFAQVMFDRAQARWTSAGEDFAVTAKSRYRAAVTAYIEQNIKESCRSYARTRFGVSDDGTSDWMNLRADHLPVRIVAANRAAGSQIALHQEVWPGKFVELKKPVFVKYEFTEEARHLFAESPPKDKLFVTAVLSPRLPEELAKKALTPIPEEDHIIKAYKFTPSKRSGATGKPKKLNRYNLVGDPLKVISNGSTTVTASIEKDDENELVTGFGCALTIPTLAHLILPVDWFKTPPASSAVEARKLAVDQKAIKDIGKLPVEDGARLEMFNYAARHITHPFECKPTKQIGPAHEHFETEPTRTEEEIVKSRKQETSIAVFVPGTNTSDWQVVYLGLNQQEQKRPEIWSLFDVSTRGKLEWLTRKEATRAALDKILPDVRTEKRIALSSAVPTSKYTTLCTVNSVVGRVRTLDEVTGERTKTRTEEGKRIKKVKTKPSKTKVATDTDMINQSSPMELVESEPAAAGASPARSEALDVDVDEMVRKARLVSAEAAMSVNVDDSDASSISRKRQVVPSKTAKRVKPSSASAAAAPALTIEKMQAAIAALEVERGTSNKLIQEATAKVAALEDSRDSASDNLKQVTEETERAEARHAKLLVAVEQQKVLIKTLTEQREERQREIDRLEATIQESNKIARLQSDRFTDLTVQVEKLRREMAEAQTAQQAAGQAREPSPAVFRAPAATQVKRPAYPHVYARDLNLDQATPGDVNMFATEVLKRGVFPLKENERHLAALRPMNGDSENATRQVFIATTSRGCVLACREKLKKGETLVFNARFMVPRSTNQPVFLDPEHSFPDGITWNDVKKIITGKFSKKFEQTGSESQVGFGQDRAPKSYLIRVGSILLRFAQGSFEDRRFLLSMALNANGTNIQLPYTEFQYLLEVLKDIKDDTIGARVLDWVIARFNIVGANITKSFPWMLVALAMRFESLVAQMDDDDIDDAPNSMSRIAALVPVSGPPPPHNVDVTYDSNMVTLTVTKTMSPGDVMSGSLLNATRKSAYGVEPYFEVFAETIVPEAQTMIPIGDELEEPQPQPVVAAAAAAASPSPSPSFRFEPPPRQPPPLHPQSSGSTPGATRQSPYVIPPENDDLYDVPESVRGKEKTPPITETVTVLQARAKEKSKRNQDEAAAAASAATAATTTTTTTTRAVQPAPSPVRRGAGAPPPVLPRQQQKHAAEETGKPSSKVVERAAKIEKLAEQSTRLTMLLVQAGKIAADEFITAYDQEHAAEAPNEESSASDGTENTGSGEESIGSEGEEDD